LVKICWKKNFKENPEYMLNYSLLCSCSKNLSSFWLKLKQQWKIEDISIFSNSSHLDFERDPPRDHPCLVRFNLVQRFQRRRFKCEMYEGRTETDAKWWQKLTKARWVKIFVGGIFSIVFYFLLIFFTNLQDWEVATAMFDGGRGHHSWSERELYMHCSFIV
jgi:hypothetical protein